MSPRPGIVAKLSIALAAGVGALLALELGLRWLRPVEFMAPASARSGERAAWNGTIHRPSSTPGLAYELAPNLDQDALGVRVTTNSLGMRDQELASDSIRILAVGDSVTFGFGVEESETFANVLQNLLAASPLARGRSIDVVNVGVSGYSTRDELFAFEHKWLELEPRVVVIGYCINDPEIDPRQPLQRVFTEPELWQHSHLARWVAQKLQVRDIRALGRGNYARYLHAVGEAPWRSVVESFERFGQLARERKFSVVLAIFPRFTPEQWVDYPIRDVHAQIASEGERNGFVVLDLLPRFEREPPATLLIEPSDSHPNPLGHRIAAEELLRLLEGRPELLGDER